MLITIDLIMITRHPGSFTTNLFAINAGRSHYCGVPAVVPRAKTLLCCNASQLFSIYSYGGNV